MKSFNQLSNTLALAIFMSLTFLGHKNALAGIITRVEVTETFGKIEVTEEIKTATGSVTVTPPGGPPQTIIMPPGGGRIELFLPGSGPGEADAGAMAKVDLDKQKKSHGWIYKSDSGYTASATSDIHKRQVIKSVTTSSGFTRRVTYFKDPNQIICLFIGDNLEGNIDFQIYLTDDTSGATLFSSITSVDNNSPDIVQDNTGLLTWTRTSGFFQGIVDEQQLPGIPPITSNNMWVLAPFSLTFDTSITLNSGETYTSNIAALTTSSGIIFNGNGFIGVSDVTTPEPTSTLGLFSLGIIGAGATIKRQVKRNHSIEKETTKIG